MIENKIITPVALIVSIYAGSQLAQGNPISINDAYLAVFPAVSALSTSGNIHKAVTGLVTSKSKLKSLDVDEPLDILVSTENNLCGELLTLNNSQDRDEYVDSIEKILSKDPKILYRTAKGVGEVSVAMGVGLGIGYVAQTIGNYMF